jgi:hypothetical protein
MKTLIVFPLLLVLAAQAQQSLYIDTQLPNSHPLKKELADKLKQSGKVMIVLLPEKADLILDLEQTGRGVSACSGSIIFPAACGNRGRAVLKNRQTGEELWSEESGGPWQMSGWSAGMVGRKLGNDLVKFLTRYAPAPATRAADALLTNQPLPVANAPLATPQSAPGIAALPVAPRPQVTAPMAAVPPSTAATKAPVQKPASKCPNGTYWGDSPSGDPVCVWIHEQ